MARNLAILLLAGTLVLGLAPAAGAADWDRYDRYGGAPPGRSSPPPPPPQYGRAPVQHAPHGETYVFGSLGFFEPESDDPLTGLPGYDAGLAGNFAIGSRVSPFLAIEGGVGFFSADRGPDELAVVPVTIGGRFVLPHPYIEPYVGAGLGFYFADLDEPSTGISDSDTTAGGYFSLGLDLWLNRKAALNFEGRYQIAEPTFDGFDVDVSGWTLGMGVRLSF